MMRISIFGAGLAAVALATPVYAQAAQAKPPCVSEQEVSALTVYSLPQIIAATRTSCGARLSANGFLATGADALAQRYASQKAPNWPLAKSALMKFASAKSDASKAGASDPLAQVGSLPDNALQPFVDAFIQQEVAQQIKPAACRPIERVMQAIAPLEPDETGTLIGVIAGLALTHDKDLPVCPVEP